MLAWIAYAFIALVWGTTFAGIAVAVKVFTPLGLVGVRFVAAGLLAIGIGRLRGEKAPAREERLTVLMTGLVMILCTYTLMFWAELTLSSGLTAVLTATLPVMLVLMGREKLSWAGWLGLGLGFAGVGLVAGLTAGEAFSLGGALAALGSNVFWSFGSLLGRARYRSRATFTRSGWQMLAGGLPALLITAPTGRILHGALTREAIGATAYLTVVGSLMAFSAYLYLLEVWPASRVGTYTYLNAIVAVAVGAWWLHEPFTLRMGLGVLAILAGVALVEYAPRSPVPALEEGA